MDLNCYRTSNNKFFNAPPRMSDGRHFTDYRPSCDSNNSVRNGNNITNSYDYRMFLTRNASQLIEVNNKHNYAKNGTFNCKKPYAQGTMAPELDKQVCNETNCAVSRNDENGIGLGRTYSVQPNDLLTPFTSPEYKLDNNKCVPNEENFNYYPLDEQEPLRQAVIGGGQMLNGGDPNVYN